MKFMKILLPALLILGLSLGHAQDEEQGRRGKKRHRGGGKMMRMMKELDLTEEQRNKIKQLREANKVGDPKIEREEVKKLKTKLKEEMKGNGSKESILSLFDQIQTAMNAKKRRRLEMVLSIREILTPEQREKFQQIRQKRKGKKGNRKGRGGRRGQEGQDHSEG